MEVKILCFHTFSPLRGGLDAQRCGEILPMGRVLSSVVICCVEGEVAQGKGYLWGWMSCGNGLAN